ncbi:MAG: thiamine phosphate synthase, partial [Rhodospirillaceae bacterium]
MTQPLASYLLSLPTRGVTPGRRGVRVLPKALLFSDEARLGLEVSGSGWVAALAALPTGSALVFRHYSLASAPRLALARSVAQLCRRHDLLFFLAGPPRLARRIGADGVHLPEGLLWRQAGRLRRRGAGAGRPLLVSAAAHGQRALRKAHQTGADITLLSPVFPTASHPGAPCIGTNRF